MPLLTLDKLEEGMVVTAEVTGMGGRVLLTPGTVLAQRHLVLLKSWGVEQVKVVGEGEEEEEMGAIDPEDPLFEECREHVEHIYSRVEKDPMIEQMMAAAAEIVYRRRRREGA